MGQREKRDVETESAQVPNSPTFRSISLLKEREANRNDQSFQTAVVHLYFLPLQYSACMRVCVVLIFLCVQGRYSYFKKGEPYYPSAGLFPFAQILYITSSLAGTDLLID